MNAAINRIELRTGDITLEKVDAIVNAANNELILGSGVAGAIRINGGSEIQAECDRRGPIKIGEAALTGAGNLPADHVIHAAAMGLGIPPTEKSIWNATLASLEIAKTNLFSTISFPALGTGVGGFDVALSASIMIGAALGFLEKNLFPETVRFILFDDNSFSTFKQVLSNYSG